jgi:hypothetical protein
MSGDVVRVSPDWLALREAADAAARSSHLVAVLQDRLSGRPLTVYDLGSGTGAMCRWLAPQFGGSQRWVMYDRDRDLLDRALKTVPPGVTAEVRVADITELVAADVAGASLITASGLLDMLAAPEIEQVARACAGIPTLLTISVVGRVELTPADPLDDAIVAAFNDHQRRLLGDRRLLGPDAVSVAVDAFKRGGARVLTRPSPWRLDGAEVALIGEWLDGWLVAAFEQEPVLADVAGDYAVRRRAQAADGDLAAVVHHTDILAY